MPSFTKSDHATKWIPVSDLSVVWAKAQRGLDENRVEKIAMDFDPDYFGVVTVTQANGAGVYHIIDGQHRVAAVRQAYGDTEKVPCNIFDCDDPKRAAQIFDKMNTTGKKPSAIDIFKVRVEAGNETEVAVDRILRDCGYRIEQSNSEGAIRAVNAVLSIYNRFGAGALASTLVALRNTWGLDHNAVDANLIRGMALFLNEHGGDIDRKHLYDKLAKQYAPGRLLGSAKNAAEFMRCTMPEAVASVIVNAYNHGRRNGKIGGAA